jgi:hypothetical protein
VEKLAMERIERRTDDPRREAIGIRSLPMIRMEDIEISHRKENYLR